MRIGLVVAGIAALGIAGFAVYRLGDSSEAVRRTQSPVQSQQVAEERGRGPKPRSRRKMDTWRISTPKASGPGRPVQVAAPEARVDPVELEPSPEVEVARTQLEGAMDLLRAAVEDRRLEPEAFDQHYRAVNDAFVAYSRAIDTSNLTERDQLEDEYRAMMEHLRDVRVKGGKREPRPAVQPVPSLD